MLLNSISDGSATVSNFCQGDDRKAMLNCLTGLGINIQKIQTDDSQHEDDTFLVKGQGIHNLSNPEKILDAGNSGTTFRLVSGLLATQPFESTITGDNSLQNRPMDRIINPLRKMGAQITGANNSSFAPIKIYGGNLSGIEYIMPIASAQVKSCIMIAGLKASGATTIIQPEFSRDHTERMLKAMGADITIDNLSIKIKPSNLSALDILVPGDISGAAFWMVLASCHSNASIILKKVGLNPSRTGVIEALRMMGANIKLSNINEEAGEPYGDIKIQSSDLNGIIIEGELIPKVIDEIPILSLAACFANGKTIIKDAGELRVKESDRISATVDGLSKLGADIKESSDGIIINGTKKLIGARVDSFDDHRIAMTMGIAGLLSSGVTEINRADANMISYPDFWQQLSNLTIKPANNVS
ncbi:MAG: 3-phosphoshikimate 1-carboxyvinyltransferase [Chloroflexi bacterium]|jgi:3-phosphoshikimate 1-carboxyvinyltransferase|nr:MAG: 3-phosphoshikimate 1-carboxyvinyltransferase [Chloroflexota bacterium]